MNMTPDEQVEAVKAALAEAGYPDAEVEWRTTGTPGVWVDEDGPIDAPPLEATWRAFAVVGDAVPHCPWDEDCPIGIPCWPCSSSAPNACACDHDWRTEPQPPIPERVS